MQLTQSGIKRFLSYGDIVLAVAVILILVMMIIPLPPPVLDVLLALNITFSLTVLLVTMYSSEPLEFSVFPSLLLFATLFRLALNVSSTRLILLRGYAGTVIESFGVFVVGGNYLVGMVIFLILVVIQFVVITNGAGRVAEVAARFTLDAMPGKQMSIDADLNAGLITEKDARKRRMAIEQEADFYGAMDGASKFVRGDAIAGIVIILVNILGGIAIGALQLGLPIMDALRRFALLTVGDGLVSQVPALLISTATGIVVTRAASEANLGQDFATQILAQPRALAIASGLLLVFGMVPGLPKMPFLILAAGTGVLAYVLDKVRKSEQAKLEAEKEAVPKPAATVGEENVLSLLKVEPMEMDFGYGLLPIADLEQGGDLVSRVTMVRKQIAMELGIVVPTVRIRDNIQLKANEYVIKIKGVEVARGEVLPDHYMAMNPGTAQAEITGIRTTEPAFGLPALWIPSSEKDHAEMLGYTVVDPGSVIATHLSEVIKAHGPELLTRQDAKNLIDNIKDNAPAVVDELIPTLMTVGEVQRVLQNLLRERISIRDLPTILEALGDAAAGTKDVDALTEYTRSRLGRSICRQYAESDGMYVLTLDPKLEEVLTDSLERTEEGVYLAPEPRVYRALISKLGAEAERMASAGHQPIVITAKSIRPYLRRLIERALPAVVVLSYSEIIPGVKVNSVGMVSLSDAS